MTRTIELDCAPGPLRPGDLIGGVIKSTGLPNKKTESRWFGCWVWDYSAETTDEQWLELRPKLIERITALYEAGYIRYGSW